MYVRIYIIHKTHRRRYRNTSKRFIFLFSSIITHYLLSLSRPYKTYLQSVYTYMYYHIMYRHRGVLYLSFPIIRARIMMYLSRCVKNLKSRKPRCIIIYACTRRGRTRDYSSGRNRLPGQRLASHEGRIYTYILCARTTRTTATRSRTSAAAIPTCGSPAGAGPALTTGRDLCSAKGTRARDGRDGGLKRQQTLRGDVKW